MPRPDSDSKTPPRDIVPRPVSTTLPRIPARQKSSITRAQKEAIDNFPDLDDPNDKMFHLVCPSEACLNFFQITFHNILLSENQCHINAAISNIISSWSHIPFSLQASKYGLPYKEAMQYSGATIVERAVRRRVERFFERQDFVNGVTKFGEDVVPSPDSTTPP